MTDSHDPLRTDPEFSTRKAAILADVLHAVDRRRARRQRRLAAVGSMLILTLIWWSREVSRTAVPLARPVPTEIAHQQTMTQPSMVLPTVPQPRVPEPRATQPSAPADFVHLVVRDDGEIVHRLAVASLRSGGVQVIRDREIDDGIRIDDESLLDWLQRAGRPSGFLRTADRFLLAPVSQSD